VVQCPSDTVRIARADESMGRRHTRKARPLLASGAQRGMSEMELFSHDYRT
jgi:hypothetical protein